MSITYDWKNIGFSYKKTDCFIKVSFRDGKWQAIEKSTDENISIHVAATSLHYGQSIFEGLKVFSQKNGDIACFRPEENAKRFILSAERLLMEAPPVELFIEAIKTAVLSNRDHIPPYGTGATMYVRPVLFGTSARVGLQPSEDYDFCVLVMPVGPYYKNGFTPVKALVIDEYDRAAPKGVGNVKAAGNYAAGMLGDKITKSQGYSISLYLDSAEKKYIDEFGTSNFLAITKDKKYVTPKSQSILNSITNMSLQQLATDMGYQVEKRSVLYSEIEKFKEIGACGTAAVLTPIYSITRDQKEITFGEENRAGEVLTKLYQEFQQIQFGEIEDRHNWMYKLN